MLAIGLAAIRAAGPRVIRFPHNTQIPSPRRPDGQPDYARPRDRGQARARERVDLRLGHLLRLANVAEEDEPLQPPAVGLLSTAAVVAARQGLTQLVKEPGLPPGRGGRQAPVGRPQHVIRLPH